MNCFVLRGHIELSRTSTLGHFLNSRIESTEMNTERSRGLRTSALVLLGFAGIVSGCGAEPPPPPASERMDVATSVEQKVAEVERAFAATMAKRDYAGFASFLSNEVVFISEKRALRGKDEVSEVWQRFFQQPTAPFSWEPERVEVLDSGLLALSTGPVRTPDGHVMATFTSIWRNEPSGWRIIFDRGVDMPECSVLPATAEVPTKTPDFSKYRESLVDAQSAYGRKEYGAFLALTQQAAAAMPNNPRAMYNVACGYALTGKSTEAITQLEHLAAMNLYFDVLHDDDLASLRGLPQFTLVVDRLEGLKKTAIGKSVPAYTLPERDTIAEGVTHDAKTGAFFVSSVHKRKIVRILPNGKTNEFASKGMFAVLGMAVDEKRRTLWACTSAVPEMKGFTEADKGRAKVMEFDIDSGKLRRVVSLDESGVNHMCNDLAVDTEGNVFLSDLGASIVYILPPGALKLDVFVPPGQFASPQGIVMASDGKSMFVADYSRGLFHVDRASREVTWLMPPNDAALVGIDGLTMVEGDLIAIQNGLRPHRVLRLSVDIAAKSVRRVDVLQMNHAAFDEPTLGVVVGKELFYVANSQWGSFDKGVIWPQDKLKEPVILRLPLD